MEVVHLNQKQLAARWHLSEACLERWRSEGMGPKFLTISPGAKLDSRRLPAGGAPRMAHINLCGRVLYRQVDIDAYEESCLATSAKTSTAQASAG